MPVTHSTLEVIPEGADDRAARAVASYNQEAQARNGNSIVSDTPYEPIIGR